MHGIPSMDGIIPNGNLFIRFVSFPFCDSIVIVPRQQPLDEGERIVVVLAVQLKDPNDQIMVTDEPVGTCKHCCTLIAPQFQSSVRRIIFVLPPSPANREHNIQKTSQFREEE
jgi:hypothetical protein